MLSHWTPFGAGLHACSTWLVPASGGGPRFGPIKRPALFWIDVAVKAALVALLLLGVIAPDLPQFEGKAWLGGALAYPISALIVPVAWFIVQRRRGRPVEYPYTLDILLVLPFLIDTAGNAADLYDTIDWWDDANHFVNWALVVAAFTQLLLRLPLGWLAGASIAIAAASGPRRLRLRPARLETHGDQQTDHT